MFPYENDGVDVSLIRWMLSLTPAQRLETLQDFVDAVAEALGKDGDARRSGGSANAR
jgi:hypothetical protein